jgi:predicted extracellular nuclease
LSIASKAIQTAKLSIVKTKLILLGLAALCVLAISLLAEIAQRQYSIAQIQGPENTSPHEGEMVTVSGIVTARTKTGIFVQTPDDNVKGFGYLRINADFPESLRNDDTRPERYSDHDPAIALFSLDSTVSKQ